MGGEMKRTLTITMVTASIILMTAIPLACKSQPALTGPEIIKQSEQKMDSVSSFHFELKQEGGGTPVAQSLEMSEAVGDIVKPDKLSVRLYVTVMGMLTQVDVITVSGTTYMTNPLSQQWEPLPSRFNAVSIFDPNSGISAILRGMTDIVELKDEKVDGLDCYHIGGNIVSQDLRPITINSLEGATIYLEVYIDKEEFLLRQIRLEGQITAEENPGIVRTIALSDFNQEVEIELPE
jgi:hypothetical protein